MLLLGGLPRGRVPGWFLLGRGARRGLVLPLATARGWDAVRVRASVSRRGVLRAVGAGPVECYVCRMKYTIQIGKCDAALWEFLTETVAPRLAGYEASIHRPAQGRSAPASASYPVTIQVNEGTVILGQWLKSVLGREQMGAVFGGDFLEAIPAPAATPEAATKVEPKVEDTQPLPRRGRTINLPDKSRDEGATLPSVVPFG